MQKCLMHIKWGHIYLESFVERLLSNREIGQHGIGVPSIRI